MSSMGLAAEIWKKEGLRGFFKGFTACFYAATACGIIYFALYKLLKGVFKDLIGEKNDLALCYMISSMTSALLTLGVQYPYDLIKCRF